VAQEFADVEVIVVNDGSSADHDAAYAAQLDAARAQLGQRLSAFTLIRRPNGHGPSYALNFGVDQACGTYVGFLDDDDVWLDPDHLSRVDASLADDADLFFSNQRAFLLGEEVADMLWLGALAQRLTALNRLPYKNGAFPVTVNDLLKTPGFCHLNCLIVRRALFQHVGGLDETIRWEGDRDVYLRLIDAASTMVYHPRFTARHNIPDPAKTANMTTAINDLQKRLSQLRVVDKAASLARHPRIRAHGRAHRAFVMRKIAAQLAISGDRRGAAAYARSAFGSRPTIGSSLSALGYTARALWP
jgi:glycosyltransferase involved in cell wall biosynthesis